MKMAGKMVNAVHWDRINTEYPVRRFPSTGETSKEIGHHWRELPQVLQSKVNNSQLILCV